MQRPLIVKSASEKKEKGNSSFNHVLVTSAGKDAPLPSMNNVRSVTTIHTNLLVTFIGRSTVLGENWIIISKLE